MRKFIIFIVILMMWGVTACADDAPNVTPTPVETAVLPTSTPIPSPTPTRTPRPSATPFAPTVVVADQAVSDDGVLVVSSVFMTEPGWVVIFAQPDSGEAVPIGFSGVPAGSSKDIEVIVDPLNVTKMLIVALHEDSGQIGTFEFLGADQPVSSDEQPSATFNVDIEVTLPVVEVDDQDIAEDGLVLIDTLLAVKPSWLVVHATSNGAIEDILGSAYVEAGLHNNFVVPILWREATPALAAILYEDNGRSRILDIPGEDLPILVGGSMVSNMFDVTLPPDIVAFDQPVIDGTITVERIISNGPSHVVVYYDDGDMPGLIIGSEFLEDGVNEQIVIEIIETAVTPQLFLFVHEDTTVGDNFDFPANDPPRLYNGRVPDPFTFNTTPGNYVITRDQAGTVDNDETTVFVPLAVVDVPAWITIHNQSNGVVGEIIGLEQLRPGINRNLMVVVDETAVTENLYAVLHLDAGTIGEYEKETDVALQRNRSIIQSPFKLLDE